LKFVSDSAITEKGFKIKWNGALRGNKYFMKLLVCFYILFITCIIIYLTLGCGGTLTSAKGSIVSPNYPQPYGKNGECFYRISVSLGSVIQVTIVDIDLEDHVSCLLDYIEIYDGINKKGHKLGRYCTSLHPVNIVSTTNHIYIRFRSDSSRQGRGFHLKYNTGENLNLILITLYLISYGIQ
jgi:cubilin